MQQNMLKDMLDRREFVRRGGALAASALLLPGLTNRRAATTPRIAVVGAGNAGTTAAYRIHKRSGWPVTLFEASDRIGGRTWTDQTFMSGRQWFEHGGGGVSSNQLDQPYGIGAMVRELGLGPMYDLWLHYPNGGLEYLFNGKFGVDRANYHAAAAVASQQFARCVWPFTYASANAENRRIDAMSAAEWIDRYVPGGLSGSAGADIAAGLMSGEYGARAMQQSAFTLVAELGGTFWPYPAKTYDERWGVPGGNDMVSRTLAGRLPPGSVRLGCTLVAIRTNADGTTTLTFEEGRRRFDQIADRVVIAIPTGGMLRVDYSKAGFSRLKIASFYEPNGESSKITLQFADQVWGSNHRSGDAESDTAVSESWQCSYIGASGRYGGAPIAPPVWVVLSTRSFAAYPVHGPAPRALVGELLSIADALYPNPQASTRFVPGKAWLDNWPSDPHIGGSYAFYRPGQWTRFAGAEWLPQGAVHFAGEHTAPYTERGTMNGAVLSGERAAREVLEALGVA